MSIPIDALLEQLHQISKRRTYAHQAWEENIRTAAAHYNDIASLNLQELDVLTALQALGLTIPDTQEIKEQS